MSKLIASKILIAKLFLFGCFSLMPVFSNDVFATEMPCHKMLMTEKSADKNCDMCQISLKTWSEDFVVSQKIKIFEGQTFAVFPQYLDLFLNDGILFLQKISTPDPPPKLNFLSVEIKNSIEFLI